MDNFTLDELNLIKCCLLTTKEFFSGFPIKYIYVKQKMKEIDNLLLKFT